VKTRIYISGVAQVRQKCAELAERAGTSPTIRKALSNAAAWISINQKMRAPIRAPIIQKRKYNKLIAKGKSDTFASFKSGVVQKKVRAATGKEIKPGLLRRSIGYRVQKKAGAWQVVVGANVGKKRKNPNNAPHAAFVGSGTKQRYAFRPRGGVVGPRKDNRGVMPPNSYIMRGFMAASSGAMERLETGVRQELNEVLSR
jgi:hypothetical protein